MAYRFKARSTTPGEYRLASGVLSQLIGLGDIIEGVGRGDGGVGTYHEATVAEVRAGVTFGAASVLVGTFEGTLYIPRYL
jgi:hypothetical protein